MENQEETFNISVEITPGLEPLTMTVSAASSHKIQKPGKHTKLLDTPLTTR